MERLEQGHLHPDHPRQTCPGRGLNRPTSSTEGGHSSKELLEQLKMLLFGTSTLFTVPYIFKGFLKMGFPHLQIDR